MVLARVFQEARSPVDEFWFQPLMSSRLLQYEVMNRVNARAPHTSMVESARRLLDRVALLDLSPDILTRALDPFPPPVRTLDGLHLATIDYLRTGGQTVALASYDERLLAAARALGIDAVEV